MNMHERIDVVLHRFGRWVTAGQVAGALREMFAESPDPRALASALEAELSWTSHGDVYCTHPLKRADWLVSTMGLAD